jgi:hypothetical protein
MNGNALLLSRLEHVESKLTALENPHSSRSKTSIKSASKKQGKVSDKFLKAEKGSGSTRGGVKNNRVSVRREGLNNDLQRDCYLDQARKRIKKESKSVSHNVKVLATALAHKKSRRKAAALRRLV